MAVTRFVKFDFCQLYYKRRRNGKAYQLFDIEVLIKAINERKLERKEFDVYDGCKVQIEKFDYDKKNSLWRLRIFRLRDSDVSFIVKPDEEAKPLELGDDEYLGEDMTMLFDIQNNVSMIQRNRYALGFKNLQKLMQKIVEKENILIEIRPISREINAKLIQKDYFKSVELRFANVKNKDIDAVGGPLRDIIKSYLRFGASGGGFNINLGRTKQESLAKEPVKELLEDISNNKELLSAAILKAKDAEDYDIEIINLFDNIYSVVIAFNIADKDVLSYQYCTNKMTERYLENREAILDLL